MARAIHVFRSPDRFIAGTVGQPGDRTFYLQAVHDKRVISVMLEKQQVQILADRIDALLEEIHRRFGTPLPEDAERVDLSPLIMPVDAEFRVGTMGLGWDAESEAVVVELLAITEGEFDESVVLDDTEEGPDAVRVFLTTAAAREFAERSSRVISAGREPCPLCGQPLDPAGHICARTNGYKRGVEFDKSLDFIDPGLLDAAADDPDDTPLAEDTPPAEEDSLEEEATGEGSAGENPESTNSESDDDPGEGPLQ
ncbi:DUF3090 domain-containing protein [Gordonia jinhuaensis]|uniref:Repeat protein (TIGR03847 family) n=1 Tax=Gordonia jinhuaensis TaxID=1517702 RepID=A0A916T1C3_9ACTN|nr:DUF3090 domain-containing protein [Gordonia jinhuaensis]GGB24405.1 hypothetical protein GCM10011489_10820 [Gordonia jinhuaensis]